MSNVDQSRDDIAKSRERPVDAPSLLEKRGKGGRGGREEAILEETQSPLASAWITTEIFTDTQIWHLDVKHVQGICFILQYPVNTPVRSWYRFFLSEKNILHVNHL